MAEITSKRLGELIQGVMKLLIENPDGFPAREAIKRLEKIVPPTPFESSTYPKYPDVRRFDKIVRFATIGVVKGGWMTKPRPGQAGRWIITDAGKEACAKFPDPENLYREMGRLYKTWRASQPPEVEVVDNAVRELTTEERLAVSLEDAKEQAQGEIKNHIEQMDPFDFQDLIAGLLKAMGYQVDWVSDPGPDKGLDIVAFSEPHGMKGVRIKVQVKRRKDKVTSDMLSSFLNRLSDSDVGLYFCTGGFTRDAEEEGRKEKKYVRLIDMDRLVKLWIDCYPKLAEAERRLLPLEPVYFVALKDRVEG